MRYAVTVFVEADSVEQAQSLAVQSLPSIPFENWPLWAKAISKFAIPEDKGVGDVIARKIGAENSAAFKAWYEMMFGKPCGCAGRHAQYNLLYPLP